MKRTVKKAIIIIIGIILVISTFICPKIIETGINLGFMRIAIGEYEQDAVRQGFYSEDEQLEEMITLREEQYYNSNDLIVRGFSNSNILLKIFFFVLAILIEAIKVLGTVCIISIFIANVNKGKKKNKKRA